MSEFKLDKEVVRKLSKVISKGLQKGLGHAKPGSMCLEAAVCYVSGEAHGDQPKCVHPFVRDILINLNDQKWSSTKSRAKGLMHVAIAQLGTSVEYDQAKSFNQHKFRLRLSDLLARQVLPNQLRKLSTITDRSVVAKEIDLNDVLMTVRESIATNFSAYSVMSTTSYITTLTRRIDGLTGVAFATEANVSHTLVSVCHQFATLVQDIVAFSSSLTSDLVATGAFGTICGSLIFIDRYIAEMHQYLDQIYKVKTKKKKIEADSMLREIVDAVLAALVDAQAPGVQFLPCI